jgi:hypothetical protein
MTSASSIFDFWIGLGLLDCPNRENSVWATQQHFAFLFCCRRGEARSLRKPMASEKLTPLFSLKDALGILAIVYIRMNYPQRIALRVGAKLPQNVSHGVVA